MVAAVDSIVELDRISEVVVSVVVRLGIVSFARLSVVEMVLIVVYEFRRVVVEFVDEVVVELVRDSEVVLAVSVENGVVDGPMVVDVGSVDGLFVFNVVCIAELAGGSVVVEVFIPDVEPVVENPVIVDSVSVVELCIVGIFLELVNRFAVVVILVGYVILVVELSVVDITLEVVDGLVVVVTEAEVLNLVH